MAVIYYSEGEHPAGFVGFRVATTVGDQKDYRQAYFSLSQHSYPRARELAYRLDRQLREQAADVTLNNRLAKPRRNAGPNVIATGLRAHIHINNKRRGSKSYTHFYPAFLVRHPTLGPEQSFRTSTLGYRNAYVQAVSLYCQLHEVDDNFRTTLVRRAPNRSIFTDYLLQKLQERGYDPDLIDLNAKLI